VSADVLDTGAPFALPIFAGLIVLLAGQRGFVAGILSLPLVVWLGEISYGIYIVHEPLWDLLSTYAVPRLGIAPSGGTLLVGYALVVLAVSGLSFRYLEHPLRRAIRARWGQPKRIPSLAEAASVDITAHH
jgi:peptidoglycan/LPS O-acetylase OafA/YrhL